jgi:hypothetical protein
MTTNKPMLGLGTRYGVSRCALRRTSLPQSRCGRGAKEGYFRNSWPGTTRTLRGAAIQIASADTAQSTMASMKASR